MKQPGALVDLVTTTVAKGCRRDVSNKYLQSVLEELIPPVLVEKICSALQCAQDVASAVVRNHFMYFDHRQLQQTGHIVKVNKCATCFKIGQKRRFKIAPNKLLYLIETKLLEHHMLTEEDHKNIGEAVVHSWIESRTELFVVRRRRTHLPHHPYGV